VQYSPFNKTMLGSVGAEGLVCLWDSEAGSCLRAMNSRHSGPASGLVFSPRSKLLVGSVGADGKILLFDINNGRCVVRSTTCQHTHTHTHTHTHGLTTHPSSCIKTIEAPEALTSVAFADDGTSLACGSASGEIDVYIYRQRERKRERDFHSFEL
jgi:WD40 repeat protein